MLLSCIEKRKKKHKRKEKQRKIVSYMDSKEKSILIKKDKIKEIRKWQEWLIIDWFER